MASLSTKTSLTERTSAPLEVHLLGLVDYESALFLQERLVYEISGRDDAQGALLLCEHPPMVTIGREGSRADVLTDQHELTAHLMDVRHLNRGGGCLVHAPGQLAVYPIVPLERLALGLADYRLLLEESIIDVCRELHVHARRERGEPGVWGRCGQLAHIGVAVRSWVSYHGAFLNVAPPLQLMRMVRASRIDDRVSSLARERERATLMHSVREGIIRHLARRLGYARMHLYTGHPLLRRTQRKVYVSA